MYLFLNDFLPGCLFAVVIIYFLMYLFMSDFLPGCLFAVVI